MSYGSIFANISETLSVDFAIISAADDGPSPISIPDVTGSDGLSDGALEEIQKEEIEEEFYFSLTDFEFNRLKSKPFHSVKEAFYPNIYSKNPFSPPEIIG